MKKLISNRCLSGGGFFTNLLNKDVKEIKKIYLSLISVGIICLGIFLGVNITKSSYALFSASIKGEKTIEVEVDTLINTTTVFNYTGDSQEYEVPKDGYYYLELGGAEGGNDDIYLSLGAKTSGYIYLEKGEKLYFYVGEQGTDYNTNCRTSGYEFNGGGIAKPAKAGVCGTTGGGATDVRLVGGSWDNISSLISRIMVAAGAGGYVTSNQYTQGSGGTLYGLKSLYTPSQANIGNYGTQTSGGAAPTKYSAGQSNGTAGSFGKGGYGGASSATATSGGGGGGGSGYYGGSGSSGIANGTFPGNGGSSYISGYAGVNSVEESTTITHTNGTLHYSGKYFIGGKMLAGQNEGNGYAKITYIGTKPRKYTTKLNNVRYIKNCISYNSANNQNHWDEIQAIYEGENVAKGKNVTGTYPEANSTTLSYKNIVDGTIDSEGSSGFGYGSSNSINQCVTVDLEQEYDLDEIAVWHAAENLTTYYDNKTYVSDDNTNFTEVINEASIEYGDGVRINPYTETYNGYIQDNLVLWYDGNSNTSTHSYNSTTWKDLSGTENDATVSGATWYNNYLSFDGVNDYAAKTSGVKYNIDKNHTIEVLLKPRKVASSYQSIFNTINTGAGVSQYGSLWIHEWNDIGFDTGDGSSHYSTNRIDVRAEDIGQYFLMTGVREDRNYKLYNKGEIQNELTYNFDARVPNPGIFIGGLSGLSYYFQGEIYSIRVYNKALTEEEILHNYMYDVEKFNLE